MLLFFRNTLSSMWYQHIAVPNHGRATATIIAVFSLTFTFSPQRHETEMAYSSFNKACTGCKVALLSKRFI